MAFDLSGPDQQFGSNQTRGVGTKCAGTKYVGTKQLRHSRYIDVQSRLGD